MLAVWIEKKPVLHIGPRPGKKSVATLTELNLTHCCTLLSEREDVEPIRKICRKIGCEWVWLPIEGGHLDTLKETDVATLLHSLSKAVEQEPQPCIYLHCSAGIHRTGFLATILLRLSGFSAADARAELARIRPVTAEQVGEDRLALAEDVARTLLASN